MRSVQAVVESPVRFIIPPLIVIGISIVELDIRIGNPLLHQVQNAQLQHSLFHAAATVKRYGIMTCHAQALIIVKQTGVALLETEDCMVILVNREIGAAGKRHHSIVIEGVGVFELKAQYSRHGFGQILLSLYNRMHVIQLLGTGICTVFLKLKALPLVKQYAGRLIISLSEHSPAFIQQTGPGLRHSALS
ncbi:MAG: hypothetical protein BWY95_01313 [Bacteroidetes bacterium ADurb.BinA104]|nr:MAG: hypothetical protein BWY95_01313 [Bacteroidetes bacterium ADurb.BinA104]